MRALIRMLILATVLCSAGEALSQRQRTKAKPSKAAKAEPASASGQAGVPLHQAMDSSMVPQGATLKARTKKKPKVVIVPARALQGSEPYIPPKNP